MDLGRVAKRVNVVGLGKYQPFSRRCVQVPWYVSLKLTQGPAQAERRKHWGQGVALPAAGGVPIVCDQGTEEHANRLGKEHSVSEIKQFISNNRAALSEQL